MVAFAYYRTGVLPLPYHVFNARCDCLKNLLLLQPCILSAYSIHLCPATRFVDRVPLTLRICSWNVAAKFPTSEEDLLGVREWLLPSGRDLPDIISIGLLETVKLTANALMVNEASPEGKRWEDLIGAFFNVPFE